MNAGIDLGYSSVKVVSESGKHTFPSFVGTPEKSSFSVVGSANAFTIMKDGKQYNIGETAVEQSRFLTRKEDRNWINSQEYMVLFHAALSTLQTSGAMTALIVTGLPVAYYDDDKETVKEKFSGVHRVHRDDRAALTVNVGECFVVPQPMGALASIAFDDGGSIVDPEMLSGRVGIIDIGGKTTNILHAHKMSDIQTETDSINIGGWDIVRAMKAQMETICPGANYNDQEIQLAVRRKAIKYTGQAIDISEDVNNILSDATDTIVARVRELWPGDGARLDRIVISGGGANLIGDRVKLFLRHSKVEVIDDSVFANALGYYKFAKYKEKIS